MRILMIVSNDVVHDARVLKEGRSLRDAGHEVTFLGWDRSRESRSRDRWDGIPIVRVRTDGFMRVLPGDTVRNPFWWRRAYRLARSQSFDVVHCHDLDTLPIGVRLKRHTGKPLVYDCHEVFGYMIEDDVPGVVTRYAFRMEKRLAPLADAVVSVNPAVKSYIDSVTGGASVLVRNCEDFLLDAYRPPAGPAFTIIYIGTLHSSRFVVQAIDAVGGMPDVRLILGGTKSLTPVIRDRCARQPNTLFLGPVPREQVMPRTIEAHAVLSMFDPERRINQVGFPNKIFEAMAAGRPCIVTEGLPMTKLVEGERCGLAVPYTAEGFRAAVIRLRDNPVLAEDLGRNGLAAARREYNWGAEAAKLRSLYDGLGKAG